MGCQTGDHGYLGLNKKKKENEPNREQVREEHHGVQNR